MDQNEPPTNILIDNLVVEENVANGTILGYISVVDPDDDMTEQFSCVLLDNSNGLFGIEGLVLVVTGAVNFEQHSSHGITVECADKGQLVYTKVFNVNVLDINDAPTGIESNSGLFEVAENMPPSTRVANLDTIDEDVADNFTYIILDNTDKFSISENELQTLISLNFEEQSLYQVSIQSVDSGGESITMTVSIEVTDVNDAPSDIFFVTAPVVPEDVAINTTIGRLEVSDEDIADTHIFETSGVSDEFWVDGQGVVYTISTLDYEESPSLLLDVVAYDSGSLNRLETLTIIVRDVNEAPHDITLSTYKTAENQPADMVVATVTVVDQDYNETFHCQLTQPSPYYFEMVNTETNITLVTSNSTINYETTRTFMITLDCYDHGGLEYRKDIEITITDNNDPPTEIRFTNALYTIPDGQMEMLLTVPTVEIHENTSPGQAVTGIIVTDEDTNQIHTCDIINSTSANSFTISSTGPSLQTSESISFEQTDRVYLDIRCSDGSESTTASLRVEIIDVNEPLSGISLVPNIVTENSPSGTGIGVFNFEDPDDGGTTSQSVYIFTLSSVSAPFVISRNSTHWYLSVSRRAINYEALSSFTLSISVLEVNPEGNFTYTQIVEVEVEDINESPSGLTFHDGYTTVVVPSDTHPGVVVDSFIVIDEDTDDVHTVTIVGGDASLFFDVSGQNLILTKMLTPGAYNLYLDVMATDSGNLSIIRHFSVSIIDMSTCNTSNPCDEHAFCFIYRPGQASCVCELGYSGDGYSCVDIDYCKSNPCHPNNSISRCKDGEGGIDNYTCNCTPGYDPPNCFNETNECADMPCDPLGTSKCVDQFNDFNCTCRKGFYGKRCETIIDNCESIPCKNNGTCHNQPGGFNCSCPLPFFGDLCEKDTTVCDKDNPCPFNGVCQQLTDTCACSPPYFHNCQHCEIGCYLDNKTNECVDYDECANNPHPCGGNVSLTCVNFEDRPCTFCCIEENGKIAFCGPLEGDIDEIHNPPGVNVPAIAVPTILIFIIIGLMLILALGYIRYRHLKGKNRGLRNEKYIPFEDEDTVPVGTTTSSNFANPLYNDPFASLQIGVANPAMTQPGYRGSFASTGTRVSYISNDSQYVEDPEKKHHSIISNPLFEDDTDGHENVDDCEEEEH